MIKKIKNFSLLLGCLALVIPVVALANAVDIESGVSILLPGNGNTYALGSDTTVQEFTVNTNNIDFLVKANSVFTLTSTDRNHFGITALDDCNFTNQTCTATESSITITCEPTAPQQTITITPSGTCTEAAAETTTSPSSGSPVPSAPAQPDAGGQEAAEGVEAKQTVTDTYSLSVPKTVTVGGVMHTVTVTKATENTAIVTIKSGFITLNLTKDQGRDVDTDEDGVNDLRVTYLGLVDGKPQLKLGSPLEEVEAEEACSLSEKGAYKTAYASAVYYVTRSCTKRPFKRSDVFFTYFNSWSDVQVVDQSKLNAITDDTLGFMPWGPKYDPKYGALVKIVTDPKVYLLLGTEKYWITSESVFEALGYSWNWIEDIDKALLDNYTIGSEISYTDHHPNYTLIKYADSPKVYRLEPDPDDSTKQVKRYIPDEATFISLNFRWDRIVTIDEAEVYTDGSVLNTVEEATAEAPASASGYQFTSFLSAGSSGEEVKQLQLKLQALGYFSADIDANSYYGPATTQAVKDFQAANGIDALGYVGPSTRAALNK